jgi:tRNA/tmRNA/rRNA uracil-C5-methylase (TrmA/RlmC/RlmD family)
LLLAALPAAARASVRLVRPESALRDRLDLQVRDGRLGMLERARGDGSQPAFVPIDDCPAAAPNLRAWLRDLVRNPPPLARASVRLRARTTHSRGIWIDADRKDLQQFQVERTPQHAWALGLLDPRRCVTLQLGQRQVQLVRDVGGRLTTIDGARQAWFDTFVGDRPLPLLTRIGDFTQPSVAGNRRLLQQVIAMAVASGEKRWLELGAGAGNMTLPMLAQGFEVRAVELATDALKANLAHAVTSLERERDPRRTMMKAAVRRCEPRVGSLDKGADAASWLVGFPAVLADPPRSGLGAFAQALATLSPALRPRTILYVSCWLEALARDAGLLQQQGYRLVEAVGVQQFIDAPDVEWVTLWKLSDA